MTPTKIISNKEISYALKNNTFSNYCLVKKNYWFYFDSNRNDLQALRYQNFLIVSKSMSLKNLETWKKEVFKLFLEPRPLFNKNVFVKIVTLNETLIFCEILNLDIWRKRIFETEIDPIFLINLGTYLLPGSSLVDGDEQIYWPKW